MNADKGIKRQQRRLFIGQLLSFAGLFLVLGVIVFFLYERSIYQDIDHSLEQQKIMLTKPAQTMSGAGGPGRPVTSRPVPFRMNMVVFNKKGKIINQAMLGERFYAYFKTLKLDRQAVNKLQNLPTSNGTFRTLLVKVPVTAADPQYAGHYVLILQNTDAQEAAIRSFRQVLILTIILFWALALGLSYWLSTRSMRPIVRSWQRQQDFVADAAHELRAPLAVIQSLIKHWPRNWLLITTFRLVRINRLPPRFRQKAMPGLTLHGLNSYWLSYWTMHLNIRKPAIPSG